MEFQSDIAGVATAFGTMASRATAAANAERLRVAEGNINAGTNQIELEERASRSQVSRALAQHQGSLAAARAFRGGGALGTGSAASDAATAAAADQAAIIEANAAAKEVALIAANRPQLDDPVLAGIQGGVQGLNIGTQIATALLNEAEVSQSQSSVAIGSGPQGIPVFQNIISSFLDIPGLDLAELFDIEGLDL